MPNSSLRQDAIQAPLDHPSTTRRPVDEGQAEHPLAIVTGAAGAIGQAICRRLVERGLTVAMLDINREVVDIAKQWQQHGLRVMSGCCDVTNLEQTKACVDGLLVSNSPIHVLVNNAGHVGFVRDFVKQDAADWSALIQTNFGSVLHMCHMVVPSMISQGYGRVVNIASDSARIGEPGVSVYAGAKGAVIAFSKVLAAEVGKHGVTVNVVSPRTVDTPMLRSALSEEDIELRRRQTPLGRLCVPDDVAQLVTYLATADSNYITGQVISVNGGSLRLG